MSENSSSDFDFSKTLSARESFEDYVSKKENDLKQTLHTSQPNYRRGNKSWVIIFVLMLSLVGLGTYTLIQNKENEKQISSLKNQSVAGAQDVNSAQNIISAEGFSLVLNQATPSNFALGRKSGSFEIIPEKQAVTTSLLTNNTKAGQTLQSGLEVSTTEYDNKLDKEAYENLIVSKLGDQFEIKSRDINLPKEIKVTKIQSKDNSEDIVYYATVTEDSYYLIKIYNQASRYPEFDDSTRFTENLLSALYLN